MKTIDPDRQTFKQIIAGIPTDQPIVMVNLLRFRDVAAYQDGTVTTGENAYTVYLGFAEPIVKQLGGQTLWSGSVHGSIIAPPEELWDKVLLVRYPSIEAFLALLKSPEFRACSYHRNAALEDSRLICTID